MRLRTVHIVAALFAAVAFVIAFMAVGAAIVSALFMGLGLAALGWLACSLIRGTGRRRGVRPETRRAPFPGSVSV